MENKNKPQKPKHSNSKCISSDWKKTLWQNPEMVRSDMGRECVAPGPMVIWAWQDQE